MLRLFFSLILTAAISPLFGLSALWAQDESAAPLDENFTEALTLDEKPAVKPLDESLFKLPENAKPSELFAFLESLETKLPQPTNQAEMEQLINALTNAYLQVAEQVLAYTDATDKEKEQARQQKAIALSARSRSDESAAAELDAFLNEMIAQAADDSAKTQAYQLKFQILADKAQNDPSVMDQLTALADEIFANEKSEELHLLALEIKAQSCLARVQTNPEAVNDLLAFLDPMIADEAAAQKVREKAQEIKAIALLFAAESDAAKLEAFENYFNSLLDGPLSPESRLRLYQLRIQTLLSGGGQPGAEPNPEDAAKLDALLDRLIKEESEDLKSLGYAVRANQLIQSVKKNPELTKTLFEYADQVLAEKPSEQVKEQMAGLKIQGYMMMIRQEQKVDDELLAFVDQMLAENPSEQFRSRLASIKMQILSMQTQLDTTKTPALEKALVELADVPGMENILPMGWATLYTAKLSTLADNKGTVAELDALLNEMKSKLGEMPILAVLICDAVDNIKKIGSNNGDEALLQRVFNDFATLCRESDNEMLQGAADMLDSTLKLQMLAGSDIAFEGIETAPEADKKFSASEMAGKYYLVDIWNTTDPSCFETIEELKELYTDFSPKGFQIVGINTDPDTKMLQRVLDVFSMPWIILSVKLSADAGLPPLPPEFNALPPGSRILVGPDGKALFVSAEIGTIRKTLEEKLGLPEVKAEPAEAQAPAAETQAPPKEN